MSNIVNIGTSYDTAGQYPLTRKGYFLTLTEMQDLGLNNSNAFKYNELMPASCIETGLNYVWRERKEEDEVDAGVLTSDFVYPTGVTAIGIDYSDRAFNFFPLKLEEKEEICFSYKEKTMRMCNVNTISSGTTDNTGEYAIFIEIPHIRMSNIRGNLNVGTLQYLELPDYNYAEYQPRKLEFNASLLSGTSFAEDSGEDISLDFVSHTTVEVDIDDWLSNPYYGSSLETELNVRNFINRYILEGRTSSPRNPLPTVKFGNLAAEVIELPLLINPTVVAISTSIEGKILTPNSGTTSGIPISFSDFTDLNDFTDFDLSFYFHNTSAFTIPVAIVDQMISANVASGEAVVIEFNTPHGGGTPTITITPILVTALPSTTRREGILISPSQFDYVEFDNSIFATLSELEITFKDDTDLDLELFKTHNYLTFNNKGEYSFQSYETNDMYNPAAILDINSLGGGNEGDNA